MSHEAMVHLLQRAQSDPAFKDKLEADPFLAAKGYQLTPTERDGLLKFIEGLPAKPRVAPRLIGQMVGRQLFLGHPWPFADMPLSDLFELAWAAGDVSKPVPSLLNEMLRRSSEGKPWESIFSNLSEADYQELRRGLNESDGIPPDLTGPSERWIRAKRDWGRSLLSELVARRASADAATASDIEDACAAVRRFLLRKPRPTAYS